MRSTFAKNNYFQAAPDAWERTKPHSVAECVVFRRRWWTTSLTSTLHSYQKADFETIQNIWSLSLNGGYNE